MEINNVSDMSFRLIVRFSLFMFNPASLPQVGEFCNLAGQACRDMFTPIFKNLERRRFDPSFYK